MEGSQNNAYFEQQAKLGRMSEDDLVQRISDCSMIVDRLGSDPVWAIVLKDATEWCAKLDANWQDIEDEHTRNHARVLKNSYMFIQRLPEKYKADLDNAKEALNANRDRGEKVPKDYDSE